MTKLRCRPCVLNHKPIAAAKIRIFCFPFAGGSAATFFSWRDKLSADFDLWAIEYPGHGTRRSEQPLKSLSMLVDDVAAGITPYLIRPFAFFGHSMGALVGFELLRRLQNSDGPRPVVFFASGCPAPSLAAERSGTCDLPDTEFIEQLRSLNGTPEEVFADKELLRFVLPALRAEFQACQTYVYKTGPRLRCPIFAYGGSVDPAVTRQNLDPWRKETAASFVMRTFPGDHFFIHTAIQMVVDALSTDLLNSATNRALVM